MRLPDRRHPRAVLALVALAAAGPHALPPSAPRLPAIVFVSRNPIAGERGAIPGFGPHHRAAITGGRLLVREPDGRVRDLLPPGALFDVSHPSVSPDARTIAFAGVRSADDTWRIWAVDLDGGRLRRVTAEAAVGDARADDLDPCWIDATTVVFASTRYRQRAQYADVPVTNLFEVRMPHEGGESSLPGRITSERNGAEKPAMDWKTGKILFARWWFNRWRAATAGGVTDDPAAAVPRDTVNLWQAMELSLDDRRAHVAAADFTTRRSAMGYQPATLADGSIVAVFAANLGLSPRPAGTGIHRLSRSGAPARRLAGAIVPGAAGDAYGGTEGLAPPSACAPAALPDGRIVFSYAPGARGDFGLYAMNADGSRITRVVDLPGTLELDAAPIVTHRAPARRATTAQLAMAPAADTSDLARRAGFRFDDLDVFADGAIARGAAPRTNGARLRFFALLSRPERTGGDTAVMIREAPVGARGVVDERGLPADVPMFEQLIGADGHVLMTAHGPAEVAGSNAGVAGATTRCVGCHLGHSTLPVPATAARPAASRDGARR